MSIRDRSCQQSSVRRPLFSIVCFLAAVSFPASTRADWPGVGENLPICTASGEQYIPQLVSDGRDGCVALTQPGWFCCFLLQKSPE
ncbi:hypothetical protein IBX73_11535, partial [candidate division WOR-3 bacterium]|nr:hypothetical protein [candidate division WOR-3 bacterium]